MDAIAIWQAGVDSVSGDQIIRKNVSLTGSTLTVCTESFNLAKINRIIIVGAGKAVASMASELCKVIEDSEVVPELIGWLNVPEGSGPQIALEKIKITA